ncbi:nucleoside permease [Chitinophaga silvisoli]|uniref:MFS transporter n=1 Tax=Chitinophaga silvisoli TaxID=2291814 RepID=A0A3E1P3S4_9BACT|nr:nucleoside permease [Chitinophaga silvisoli]RFM34821.1 MFS transporter [Chitinophaga silvisoli]
MKASTSIRLSVMMFLEFFIWGSWFVTLGTYLSANLHASGIATANVFSTQSYGAIIAPFIIGMIADKFFNAERILGVLHLAGAVLMFQMFRSEDVSVFYPYVFAYMVLFMPTLALVNSVSFRQMNNPEKEFSVIRMFGTIGWIIAGVLVSVMAWDSPDGVSAGLLRNTFAMAGIASLILGIYSFSLPKTPPVKDKNQKESIGEILGLDAIKLLKNGNFLVFFISSILICIPLAFYYQNAHRFFEEMKMPNVTVMMTIGQLSETFLILLIPVFFKKYGFKKTIMAGMLAWAVRYALFAYGDANGLLFMLIIGIALHGICYDFFFVSGQIYTDQQAGEKYKSAAQGLITLATYGVGMLIGFWIAGLISDHYKDLPLAESWRHVWIIPAGIALAVCLLFLALFKDKQTKPVL